MSPNLLICWKTRFSSVSLTLFPTGTFFLSKYINISTDTTYSYKEAYPSRFNIGDIVEVQFSCVGVRLLPKSGQERWKMIPTLRAVALLEDKFTLVSNINIYLYDYSNWNQSSNQCHIYQDFKQTLLWQVQEAWRERVAIVLMVKTRCSEWTLTWQADPAMSQKRQYNQNDL